jgi:hypothetical protein
LRTRDRQEVWRGLICDHVVATLWFSDQLTSVQVWRIGHNILFEQVMDSKEYQNEVKTLDFVSYESESGLIFYRLTLRFKMY